MWISRSSCTQRELNMLSCFSLSLCCSSPLLLERQSWYRVKNNFTLHNKWWCMTSRSDQGMKNNHEQNKLQLKWNGTTGISHFAYFHSARNYYEPWATVPFETNFLLLKPELPERSFGAFGLCFKGTCSPSQIFKGAARAGVGCRAQAPSGPCSHAAQGAAPGARSMHRDGQQAQGRAEAQEF